MQILQYYLNDSANKHCFSPMSHTPTADQKKAAQITETLVVHNLLSELPPDTQQRIRQIALREHTSIMQVARKAILHFTQPQAA